MSTYIIIASVNSNFGPIMVPAMLNCIYIELLKQALFDRIDPSYIL